MSSADPAAAHRPARLRVFVGDVQGCLEELDALLAAIPFDPTRHELWCVGDVVNRGADSAGVLRRLIEIGGDTVLGNHDLHLLAVAAGRHKLGRRDTIRDVLEAPDRQALLAWLRARPLVRVWDDIVLVHAGLHPSWRDVRAVAAPLEAAIARGELPLDDSALDFLTRVRHCDPLGQRPDDEWEPGPPFAPWDFHYNGVHTVVCGHWAARGLVKRADLVSLDTGCLWGGRLTAWIAEEDRIVSVPARRAYQQIDRPGTTLPA